MSRVSILVVDDDQPFRDRLARAFADRGLAVSVAADHASALAEARKDPPELAVVDLKMPGRSGLELVRDLRALDAGTKVVVLTGYGSIATAVEAIKLGATNYLPKPADADEILTALGAIDAGPAVGAGAAGAASSSAAAAASSGGEVAADVEEPSTPTLARAEWEHIQRVLADCGGNISEAARRLGLHRRSLQRKLSKYPP